MESIIRHRRSQVQERYCLLTTFIVSIFLFWFIFVIFAGFMSCFCHFCWFCFLSFLLVLLFVIFAGLMSYVVFFFVEWPACLIVYSVLFATYTLYICSTWSICLLFQFTMSTWLLLKCNFFHLFVTLWMCSLNFFPDLLYYSFWHFAVYSLSIHSIVLILVLISHFLIVSCAFLCPPLG